MKTPFTLFIGLVLHHAASAQKPSAADDDLRLNHIQVIGSHNSYKQAIDSALLNVIEQSNPATAQSLDYSHIPITEQLALGLSNLELDVYADAEGGKYAHPQGLEWASESTPYDPDGAMQQPGFKVLHVQDIDFRSNCFTFEQCLQELKTWSEANPDHLPIFITMNAKDDPIDKPGFTVPEKFTAEVIDQLDETVLETLGSENLITPDQVRGDYETLESAVLDGNWPTLKEARGKFLFVLDEVGEKRDAYLQGYPSLRGRTLFANAEPGTPEAAFLIMNEPIDQADTIRDRVKRGYLVRTRADANTEQARNNDRSMFEAALQSGAQIITTDYYAKSTHFPSDYVVSFEDGTYFRINPRYEEAEVRK